MGQNVITDPPVTSPNNFGPYWNGICTYHGKRTSIVWRGRRWHRRFHMHWVEGTLIKLELLLDLLFGQPLGVRPRGIVHQSIFQKGAKDECHAYLKMIDRLGGYVFIVIPTTKRECRRTFFISKRGFLCTFLFWPKKESFSTVCLLTLLTCT